MELKSTFNKVEKQNEKKRLTFNFILCLYILNYIFL